MAQPQVSWMMMHCYISVGERDARALLNYAFASDVIEKINNDALKSNLLKLLSQKLNTTVEFEE